MIKMTKWIVKKHGESTKACNAEPGQCEYCSIDVAYAICSPWTPSVYITRTQAWRPLDLHPDWRTWDGATTKGNK